MEPAAPTTRINPGGTLSLVNSRKSISTRKLLHLLKVVAINCLVLFVLLELFSVGAFLFERRELFYTRSRVKEQTIKAQVETELSLNSNNPSPVFQLHPYFGFVYRRSHVAEGLPTNDFGFQTYDLPFRKSSNNQFIIGVFGGSVAELYSRYELENHLLAKALHELRDLQNKEVIILNFAAAAYKEPQQALVLNYFLALGQEFDIIINIDGFNETAISSWNNKNNVDLSMPAHFVALPLLELANKNFSAEDLTLTLELLQTKNQLRDALNQLYSCRLATCYTLRWLQVKYLISQYGQKSQALEQRKRDGPDNDSLIYLKTIKKPLDDAVVYNQIANVWANSSLAMRDLASARGIQYFHFIQPNQYYTTGRAFSEAEKKNAFDENSPFKIGVVKGYPKLLSRISSLQAAGVRVFNAVNVFDQVGDMVYVDNCCHYTSAGNEIFGNYVARTIVTTVDTASRRAPRSKI